MSSTSSDRSTPAADRPVYRLGQLAERVGGEIVGGSPDLEIRGVATLQKAAADELSFFTNPKYRRDYRETSAGAVLVGPDMEPGERPLLRAKHPYFAWAQLLDLYHPVPAPEPGVSQQASVAADATLGEGVSVAPFAVIEGQAQVGDGAVIGAHAVVGRGAQVGDRSQLRPGVVLYPGTVVGADCLIHSGVVLGADGFGFATVDGRHRKVPQVGRAVLGDDVEIGANTTIDRGSIEDTVVGDGCRIDNLVMLAHGVQVGRGSVIAAQVGIAGSTILGAYNMWGGQAAAVGHLKVGDQAGVAAGAGLFDSFPEGGRISGRPAKAHADWLREVTVMRRLPEMRRELNALKRRLAELEGAAAASEDD